MKKRGRILIVLMMCFGVIVAQDDVEDETITSLSKEKLIAVFEQYQQAYSAVFKTGSTVADVDVLYSFYTDDFEYNHPKYGGIYTRKHLYDNTVKFLKAGQYNGGKKRNTLKRIVGLDAIVVEQQSEEKTETTMTLFKFRGSKIYYMEEYW